ncbi:MAG: amidohydrolase family protein [Gammaproteobacteria bacterium]
MRLLVRGAFALFTLTAVGLAFADSPSEELGPVDLIVTHAHVKTPGGWAEAFAVRRGVIVETGDAKSVEALRAAGTRVVDLGGDTVLPGMHDVHVHPLGAGLAGRQCVIKQGSTLSQTQASVKACVKAAAPGAWVAGGQWDASALGRIPNRAMLDSVSPSNPVLLDDTSGHSAWANSKALAQAGITRDTPNPPGGIIERNASGEPTGILRESATEMVRQNIPGPTQAEVEAALAGSLRLMLSYGITSFTEAALGYAAGPEKELRAYAALSDSGVLKQRARLCISWAPDDHFEKVLATRNEFARERISPDCVKIFLDGVPTDSHTAAMLQPYQGAVGGRADKAAEKGMLLVEQARIDAAVTRFDRMGLTVKFHSAGDAAVQAGLNAIETARRANGFSAQMHNVGHCTFVSKQDIARARAIGATFEVSPYLWGPTPINDDITAAVGPEIIKRVWPVREMIDSGALVVPGSDWSVVPSVSPWIGVETLVSREKPGGSPQSFGKAEAISLKEALDLFTVNAARQEGTANRLGYLAPGMLADFIVLDRNPYDVPVTQVHDTTVKQTYIQGELVYQKAPEVGQSSADGLRVDVFAGGFASVNSFIFSNGHSLILLDAQRKTVEAQKLAEVIRAKQLPLSHILISHGHTDHFTGMAYLHQQFPDAQIVVANRAIRDDIKSYAIYMDSGGQTGGEPALEPALRPKTKSNPSGFDYEKTIHLLSGNKLTLKGGGTLELTTDYKPTEAAHMTTVYNRELNALFLADFGYHKVHLWLGDDITRERIATWRSELLRIKARYAPLDPTVYPGHGAPGDITLVDDMVRYIDDFTRVTAAAKSREEAMQSMQALYPDYEQADFFLKYSVENHVK